MSELRIGDLCARIPVIQGGMGVGVSLAGLAGACAAAGGVGVISTAQIGFRDPDFDKNPIACNLKAIGDEIAKARKKANGGIIGVNIMVATKRYEDYVKAAVAAGVDLIISGAGLPMTLPEVAGKSKIAPIVSSRKSLGVIAKYWKKKFDRKPDLVVIEGPLAGGHLGFTAEEIEAYTVTKQKDYDDEVKAIIDLADELQVPVVVAGGAFMSVRIWNIIWHWAQKGCRLPHVLSQHRSAMLPMPTNRHILMRKRKILFSSKAQWECQGVRYTMLFWIR